ncbi:MAG: tRNA uridine-5-carboxymethylaminomethyl(34) synthesis GTPase MnmE [Lachnospiraceae bacterium]
MHSETIAAIATGMNPAGIGIIRISGAEAFLIASKLFRLKNHKELNSFQSHHVYYGFLFDGKELIDEVLLLVMKGPNSFTKEDTIEINCHGGILIMNRILETVIKYGARAAEPGEFTKRAFLNGRIDLSEAEAVIDLIHSKNQYALHNSLNQLTGKLYEKIKQIRDAILYEVAFIESALDDPEHISLDGYPENLKEKVQNLYEQVHLLSDSFRDGRVLSEGIRTVIIGKPNVGKSSLLNVLVGADRAIVTEIAGTTRDALEEKVQIDGISLNITDTAGIRNTNDLVEKIGVERAMKYAKEADLILMLIDSSVSLDDMDLELFDFIKDKQTIVLLNKSDLQQVVCAEDIKKYTDSKIIQISARDEIGILEFKLYIKELFLSGRMNYNDEVFITNVRHKDLLCDTERSLREVLQSIDSGMPEDFYSIDLINAYDDLGRIIGEQIEEDVVNEIFAKFCMGK